MGFTTPQRGRVRGQAPVSLQRLDYASLSWWHAKVFAVASLSFFTASYNIFMVSIIKNMISLSLYYNVPSKTTPVQYGNMPSYTALAVSGSNIVGVFAGQLLFGWLGDIYGRKRMLRWCLLVIILGTVGQVANGSQSTADTFVDSFCLWRISLGLGCGGVYPLSAVLLSEFSPKVFRGSLLGSLFLCQGPGTIAGCVVGMVVMTIYRPQISVECHVNTPCPSLQTAWAVCLSIGILPALIALALTTTILESPRYTSHVLQDEDATRHAVKRLIEGEDDGFEVEHAKQPRDAPLWRVWSWRDVRRWLRDPANAKVLCATSLTWFLLDVAYYGEQQALLTPVIHDLGYDSVVTIRHGAGHRIVDRCYNFCVGYALITAIGTIPGYFFTVAMIDLIGRKVITYLGFAAVAVVLLLMSAAYDVLLQQSWLYLILFSLTLFFCNFGPNATTFIVPAESFPARFRCTFYGVSAAAGKAGAVVGVFGLGVLATSWGLQGTLGVLCIFMVAGILCSSLLPETNGESLEDMNEIGELQTQRTRSSSSLLTSPRQMSSTSMQEGKLRRSSLIKAALGLGQRSKVGS